MYFEGTFNNHFHFCSVSEFLLSILILNLLHVGQRLCSSEFYGISSLKNEPTYETIDPKSVMLPYVNET